jgi:hypothetical protein
VEWVKPIDQVERELREHGVFTLVDARAKTLRFYGWTRDQATLNRLTDTVKGRVEEMTSYLIAQPRKGENA